MRPTIDELNVTTFRNCKLAPRHPVFRVMLDQITRESDATDARRMSAWVHDSARERGGMSHELDHLHGNQ